GSDPFKGPVLLEAFGEHAPGLPHVRAPAAGADGAQDAPCEAAFAQDEAHARFPVPVAACHGFDEVLPDVDGPPGALGIAEALEVRHVADDGVIGIADDGIENPREALRL